MKDSKREVFSEILTSKDVREMLCVSHTTLQRMRNRGDLTGYKLSGRVYYKRSEIMSSLESGKLASACSVSNSKNQKSKVGNSKIEGTPAKN